MNQLLSPLCSLFGMQSQSYQVYVPRNTFVATLDTQLSDFRLQDPRQFRGSSIRSDPANCASPFSGKQGLAQCKTFCHSSCPELNPSTQGQVKANIVALTNYVNAIEEAFNDTVAELAPKLDRITINGNFQIQLVEDASASLIATLVAKINSVLPKAAPLNLTVTVSATGGLRFLA